MIKIAEWESKTKQKKGGRGTREEEDSVLIIRSRKNHLGNLVGRHRGIR